MKLALRYLVSLIYDSHIMNLNITGESYVVMIIKI